MRTIHPKRSGAAMLWALVVLAVLGVTTAMAVSQFGAVRRGLDRRQNKLQAQWLARAGCEVAVSRLLAQPDYTGEVLAPIADAQVRIVVAKDVTKPDTFHIRCDADYPIDQRGMVSQAAMRVVTRGIANGKTRIDVTGTD
jgi:type II secretory pathway pseudopilin PulG